MPKTTVKWGKFSVFSVTTSLTLHIILLLEIWIRKGLRSANQITLHVWSRSNIPCLQLTSWQQWWKKMVDVKRFWRDLDLDHSFYCTYNIFVMKFWRKTAANLLSWEKFLHLKTFDCYGRLKSRKKQFENNSLYLRALVQYLIVIWT